MVFVGQGSFCPSSFSISLFFYAVCVFFLFRMAIIDSPAIGHPQPPPFFLSSSSPMVPIERSTAFPCILPPDPRPSSPAVRPRKITGRGFKFLGPLLGNRPRFLFTSKQRLLKRNQQFTGFLTTVPPKLPSPQSLLPQNYLHDALDFPPHK